MFYKNVIIRSSSCNINNIWYNSPRIEHLFLSVPSPSLFLTFLATSKHLRSGTRPPRACEAFYLRIWETKRKAPSDLTTAEKSLCVGRVYLQGFVAIFQGFVRAVQTELSERKVQVEGKQCYLDRLRLCSALRFPVPQQLRCLFIAIFGVVITALVETTVAKAA